MQKCSHVSLRPQNILVLNLTGKDVGNTSAKWKDVCYTDRRTHKTRMVQETRGSYEIPFLPWVSQSLLGRRQFCSAEKKCMRMSLPQEKGSAAKAQLLLILKVCIERVGTPY
jgi:hypothetical protein